LVEQYCPLVWRLLGKFDNLTRTEKEDLSHAVFVILLDKGLKSFRGTTVHEFRAYLKMITVNEAKSYLRRHGRRLEILDPFLIGDEEEGESPSAGSFLPAPNPGPEEQTARQERLRGVLRCIQELPVLDQEIFWLEARGHSYKEMTAMLRIPQGTVASKYYRAKAKIEECPRKAGFL
jgi:RNA polymerase sigma factor (sigma-70 family)